MNVRILDWTPDGPLTACVDCERAFRGGVDGFGLRRLWCRPCDAEHERRERKQMADPSQKRPRQRHWLYRDTPKPAPPLVAAPGEYVLMTDATDEVEAMIAAETRK